MGFVSLWISSLVVPNLVLHYLTCLWFAMLNITQKQKCNAILHSILHCYFSVYILSLLKRNVSQRLRNVTKYVTFSGRINRYVNSFILICAVFEQYVRLDFDVINLQRYCDYTGCYVSDHINIYDGPDPSYPLLDLLLGTLYSNSAGKQSYTGSQRYMFVTFRTYLNYVTGYDGFQAEYTSTQSSERIRHNIPLFSICLLEKT